MLINSSGAELPKNALTVLTRFQGAVTAAPFKRQINSYYMITIHKYQFELGREIVIEMPEMAKIIAVQMQNEEPVMWAIVDTGLPIVKRKFEAVWTGEELNGAWFHRTHIATVQDIYVWHIFE